MASTRQQLYFLTIFGLRTSGYAIWSCHFGSKIGFRDRILIAIVNRWKNIVLRHTKMVCVYGLQLESNHIANKSGWCLVQFTYRIVGATMCMVRNYVD